MSRKLIVTGGVLLCLALGTSDLFAQGRGGFGFGGGFGRGGGGVLGLAGLQPVHEELGIDKDAETIDKITKLLAAYNADVQAAVQEAGGGDFQAIQALSEEERQKVFQKINEGTQKATAKHLPELKKILKPEQFERLQQISYQQAGSAALLDPEVSKALELTKEQTEKISAVQAEFGNKQRELFQSSFGGDFQETMRKMQELNAERDKKAQEVLSKSQQDKYAKLRGKPYDLEKLRAAFGRGFGGRGGRGRAGGGQAEQPKDSKKEDKK